MEMLCGHTLSHFEHLIQSAAEGLLAGNSSFALFLVIFAARNLL
jgi:hypothetical protein